MSHQAESSRLNPKKIPDITNNNCEIKRSNQNKQWKNRVSKKNKDIKQNNR